MIKFTIPGRPVPAVRMTRKGKYVKRRAQEYLEYKDTVGWSAKAAGVRLTTGRIGIKITVYLSGKTQGDWDNYGKAVCDGLNGIAYIDDRQITEGYVRKVLGVDKKDERVEVEIYERGDSRNEQDKDRVD